MYYVHCTVQSVQFTLYYGLCALYYVLLSRCRVRCTTAWILIAHLRASSDTRYQQELVALLAQIWSSGSDPVTPLLPLSPSVPFWMTAAGQHIQRLKRESEESKQSSDSMLLMPLVGARDTENGANASSLENNPEVEQR